MKRFLPTLFVHPTSCFKEDKKPAPLDSADVTGLSTNSFCPLIPIFSRKSAKRSRFAGKQAKRLPCDSLTFEL
ncbi:hypothetical protein [Stomatobaculum longum]|uniref:hypothetical protein n=1 Tax=Stomatobaculum longum TaxID=796942 RepID=UPI0028EBBC18|nr:hypothetical protein [Stomatobaculum longum]